MTPHESTSSSDAYKEATATPPEGRPSQIPHRTPEGSPSRGSGFTSPPQDTQAFSQYIHPKPALSEDVDDEVKEGVWGYLLPLDNAKYGSSLVLRKRTACPAPRDMTDFGKDSGKRQKGNGKDFKKEEQVYEETKLKGIASGGYLIGRHPECGKGILLIIGGLAYALRSYNRRSHCFK